jgi:hypothetical protein
VTASSVAAKSSETAAKADMRAGKTLGAPNGAVCTRISRTIPKLRRMADVGTVRCIHLQVLTLMDIASVSGMFQGQIHFSSSQVTVWTVDDPFRYRILDQEALSDADICLAFPRRSYPDEARIPGTRVSSPRNGLRELRLMDDTFYLRSASINVFNGMISLTLSCAGTHYMR